jgi:hypothetical protein
MSRSHRACPLDYAAFLERLPFAGSAGTETLARDRASPWASFATARNTTERATTTAAPMTQVSNDGITIVVAFLPRSGQCFQHQIERRGGGAPHARESSAHYHFPQSGFTALSAESRTDFLR